MRMKMPWIFTFCVRRERYLGHPPSCNLKKYYVFRLLQIYCYLLNSPRTRFLWSWHIFVRQAIKKSNRIVPSVLIGTNEVKVNLFHFLKIFKNKLLLFFDLIYREAGENVKNNGDCSLYIDSIPAAQKISTLPLRKASSEWLWVL